MPRFTIATLEQLNNYPNARFEEGEIVYVENDKTTLIYKNGEWVKFETNNSSFSLTEYELNKMIVNQLTCLGEEALAAKVGELNEYERNNRAGTYMLLCRDINYYTIFRPQVEFISSDLDTFGKEVISCARDVGNIVSIDVLPNNTVEFWVKTSTDEAYCMYLFDASGFVVPYRR